MAPSQMGIKIKDRRRRRLPAYEIKPGDVISSGGLDYYVTRTQWSASEGQWAIEGFRDSGEIFRWKRAIPGRERYDVHGRWRIVVEPIGREEQDPS